MGSRINGSYSLDIQRKDPKIASLETQQKTVETVKKIFLGLGTGAILVGALGCLMAALGMSIPASIQQKLLVVIGAGMASNFVVMLLKLSSYRIANDIRYQELLVKHGFDKQFEEEAVTRFEEEAVTRSIGQTLSVDGKPAVPLTNLNISTEV